MNDGLPSDVAAAWGLRVHPGKGPKPGVSLERTVAAAVKIASRDGLAAVSMSRVAADLGASTMSLYRYVNAKDELVKLMIDTAWGRAPGRGTGCGLARRAVRLGVGDARRIPAAPVGDARPDQRAAGHAQRGRLVRAGLG